MTEISYDLNFPVALFGSRPLGCSFLVSVFIFWILLKSSGFLASDDRDPFRWVELEYTVFKNDYQKILSKGLKVSVALRPLSVP